MKNQLVETIKLIATKEKSAFAISLREHLDNLLHEKMANQYVSFCESLYLPNEELSENGMTPVQEQLEKIVQKPVNSLIASLQEAVKDEKTIVHRFMNGESVTINHDDSRCLINLHDSLNKINQDKMRKLMSENYSEYNKILQFSKKHIERTLR